jgi:hypothetical protein
MAGDWRRLNGEELHNLYASPSIIRVIKSRRMRWAEHVPRMGETRNAHNVLFGKSERKRRLERSGRRWEDNIKMDHRETEREVLDWIHPAQDREQWRLF